jgi:hypothetical protein
VNGSGDGCGMEAAEVERFLSSTVSRVAAGGQFTHLLSQAELLIFLTLEDGEPIVVKCHPRVVVVKCTPACGMAQDHLGSMLATDDPDM